jgi:cobalt-zinc-cadmium efflux system protein
MNKVKNYSVHNYNDLSGIAHDDDHHNNLDNDHGKISIHDHHSSHTRDVSSKILLGCLIITFLFSIIEAIGGYLIKSIALQSDAIHMFTDAIGLLIAYVANKISKKPANLILTFGYGKAEALGALINCLFTFMLTIGLIVEVVQRLWTSVEVSGSWLFLIALFGIIVNGVIAYTLSKSDSLNTKAAFLHALSDMFGAFIALIAGVIIYYTGIYLVDPILSIILIILLLISNYRLIKKSILVLMAGVPPHLDYNKIGEDIESIEGVLGVHDLHVWYISANQVALSAHITTKAGDLDWVQILNNCQKMLSNKHRIKHVTLQYEKYDSYEKYIH